MARDRDSKAAKNPARIPSVEPRSSRRFEQTATACDAPRDPDPAAVCWEGPPVGTVLDGAYRIVGALGQGGMGVVMLARDERLERNVAIKLIRPGRMATKGARDRFLTEARAMARVRHENVVEIYAFGEVEDTPYFVMEYVPGTNLANWLEDALLRDHLPAIDESLGYLDQICRGVSAIHASGTVHGDLKPGNILLGPASRVAVADMGLSRVLDALDDSALHPMAGTPAYMAPECVSTDLAPELVQRRDVYALGVMAYEMLTGRQPHDIGSAADITLRTLRSVNGGLAIGSADGTHGAQSQALAAAHA